MSLPIPLFAASGGDLLPFIIGGVFLLVKWLIDKAKEAAPPDSPTATTRPPATTEEERARRFREALGLPPEDGPTTTMRAPTPAASEMRGERPASMHGAPPSSRKGAQFPVPPIIHEQRSRRKKKPLPPPSPRREEKPSLDELPAPTTRAGQITAGELKVPAYHELHTKSSEVQAIPFERRPHAAGEPLGQPVPAAELRALLRRRSSLRQAILLREILGPPPGLQTSRGGFGPH